MGIIAKSAIDRFINRPLRDSSLAKQLSDEQLDAKIAKLNPQPIFHTPLRKHQKVCFLLGVKHSEYLLFLEAGLGKTLCVLSLFDYARLVRSETRGRCAACGYVGEVKWLQDEPTECPLCGRCTLTQDGRERAIVLAPYGSNLAQWDQQVREHTPHLTIAQVDGQGEGERWLQVKNPNADLVVITYVGFLALICQSKGEDEKGWKIDKAKLKEFCKHFTFFIGDEFSQLCGRHDALTTKAVSKLSHACQYRYALTGTPYGKDPAALYSQFFAIDRGITLGETLGLFRAALFIESKNYWSGGSDWTFDKRKKGILSRLIRHNSIRYTAGECLDLPKRNYQQIPVTFDSETWVYYDALTKKIREAEGDFELLKSSFLNMRQLVAGYLTLRNDKGERQTIFFRHTPKIDAVVDLVQTIPQDRKIIVFHEYRTSGELFTRKLTEKKIKHKWLHGGTRRKAEVIEQFLTDPKINVLVSSSAGAMGLNFQAANYCCFLERNTDPKMNEQEERRVWRMGQTRPVFYYSAVVHGSIDERIEQSLAAGKNLFAQLIDGKCKDLRRGK